ncbi:MAG: RNA-binding S4 domain-containing protein [Gammaproteobacteria bacterium]|nr:RNA-binding S4 domain-containing protein [Gammaproteobacteria bacterium]
MSELRAASLRIDRWLWFARFYKTRSAASLAVSGGHVRVNGERAKAGRAVAPGDVVELTRQQSYMRVTVAVIPARRGPAREAQLCYVEQESDRAAREERAASIRRDRMQMPRTSGRPDKHTRRKLRERNRGD